ncbi:MAG: RNA polymerase sigma factor, partial [Planctomycetota bacterium]
CVNHALEARRSRREADPVDDRFPERRREDADMREKETQAVQSALDDLPDDYRVPLLLHYYDGLTYEQIAGVLDCPQGTVGTRIHRGLDRLRKVLGPAAAGTSAAVMFAMAKDAEAIDVPRRVLEGVEKAIASSAAPTSIPRAVEPAVPPTTPLWPRALWLVPVAALLIVGTAVVVRSLKESSTATERPGRSPAPDRSTARGPSKRAQEKAGAPVTPEGELPTPVVPVDDRQKLLICVNNLSQLWKQMNSYMVQYGGPYKLMPEESGYAFWLVLVNKGTPPLVSGAWDIFVCPASGAEPRKGFTNYRGPNGNVNWFGDGDVVGCCEPGHHPDGRINVLRKSGDVQTVGPSSSLYKNALASTTTTGDPNRPLGAEEVLRKNENFALRALNVLDRGSREVRALPDSAGRYWTGDVAGLYHFSKREGTRPAIEEALAGADALPLSWGNPLPRVPLSGYWFQAIRIEGAVDGRHPRRYGFVAFPDQYGVSGRFTFLMLGHEGDWQGSRYKKDLGGAAVDAWPSEEELDGWETAPFWP